MFAHGGKHVITVHPMVEIVQPKDCLSLSIGLASRSFTNFFSQDLFSEMHPLGGVRDAARGGSLFGPLPGGSPPTPLGQVWPRPNGAFFRGVTEAQKYFSDDFAYT